MNYDYRNTPPYNYYQPVQQAPKSLAKAFSIVSLVMGIIANVTCCGGILFGFVGLVFGIIAAIKTKNGQSKGKWITGIILSGVGMIIGIICYCIYLYIRHDFQSAGGY